MFYLGIDVHKKVLCLNIKNEACETVFRRKLNAAQCEAELGALAARYAPLKVVLEASGSSEWLIDLLRPLVREVVLAHPGQLKIISQTVKKTDKIDAAVLAELLAQDYIPRAYIASASEREDRALVRAHRYLSRMARGAKQRVRAALARHNWLEPAGTDWWTRAGRAWLLGLDWPPFERLELETTLKVLDEVVAQQRPVARQIEQRAEEHEQAKLLRSIPYLGHITGHGHGYLRALLVEAAWRLVLHDERQREVFAAIAKRRGRKIAIVATARRLLAIAVAMLRSGRRYGEAAPAATGLPQPQTA